MKLLSNGKSYIGLFGSIRNENGEVITSPSINLIDRKTKFNITKIDGETFSIDTPPTHKLELGEEVSLVQADFNIDVIISKVGNTGYKVVKRFDLQNSFKNSEIIPDGTVEAYRENDVLTLNSLSDGAYYSEYGELLLVKPGFYHLGSISADKVYIRKPILRGRAVEEWQLARLISTAYDDVMTALENYQVNDYDKYKYIDTGKISELIIFKAIANYEDSLPESEEIDRTFTLKYESKITGFSPKKQIDEDNTVQEATKRGLKY